MKFLSLLVSFSFLTISLSFANDHSFVSLVPTSCSVSGENAGKVSVVGGDLVILNCLLLSGKAICSQSEGSPENYNVVPTEKKGLFALVSEFGSTKILLNGSTGNFSIAGSYFDLERASLNTKHCYGKVIIK
jgi:hypothetical protein